MGCILVFELRRWLFSFVLLCFRGRTFYLVRGGYLGGSGRDLRFVSSVLGLSRN